MSVIISFLPQRRDDSYVLECQGDTVVIDGAVFDFSPLPEGVALKSISTTFGE